MRLDKGERLPRFFFGERGGEGGVGGLSGEVSVPESWFILWKF